MFPQVFFNSLRLETVNMLPAVGICWNFSPGYLNEVNRPLSHCTLMVPPLNSQPSINKWLTSHGRGGKKEMRAFSNCLLWPIIVVCMRKAAVAWINHKGELSAASWSLAPTYNIAESFTSASVKSVISDQQVLDILPNRDLSTNHNVIKG